MNTAPTFNCSFRCYYDAAGESEIYNMHYQRLPLADIPRWLDAYRFTHPNVKSISVKVWFSSESAAE